MPRSAAVASYSCLSPRHASLYITSAHSVSDCRFIAGFRYTEAVEGYIKGYRRVFWQGSTGGQAIGPPYHSLSLLVCYQCLELQCGITCAASYLLNKRLLIKGYHDTAPGIYIDDNFSITTGTCWVNPAVLDFYNLRFMALKPSCLASLLWASCCLSLCCTSQTTGGHPVLLGGQSPCNWIQKP